ncbi:hypothetical protein JW935_29335 [candidate division KSB1 bacterium]|nr:hypothetical protein [candidate division KSB1 bacterium]
MNVCRPLYILFFIISVTFSQNEKLELVKADIFAGEKDYIRRFIGNVQFRQGEALLNCDQALQYVQEGRYVLQGNVHIFDSEKQLMADIVLYYEENRVAHAQQNVRLVDSLRTLTADQVLYYEKEDKAVADGHVVIADTVENYRLSGVHADYYRRTGYAKMTGQPRFVQLDSLQQEELAITGKTMEMISDGDTIRVIDQVQVNKDSVAAFCGELEFLRNSDLIILQVEPRAEQTGNYLFGDTLELLLKDRNIRAIHIVNNAIVISKNDTVANMNIPYDALTGEDVLVFLSDNQIDSVTVKGRATSFYHVIEKGNEKGLNKTLGDFLKIYFRDGRVSDVEVSSSPSVSEGAFYPKRNEKVIRQELLQVLEKLKIETANDGGTPGSGL